MAISFFHKGRTPRDFCIKRLSRMSPARPMKTVAWGGIRTPDLRVMSPTSCPLLYPAMCPDFSGQFKLLVMGKSNDQLKYSFIESGITSTNSLPRLYQVKNFFFSRSFFLLSMNRGSVGMNFE